MKKDKIHSGSIVIIMSLFIITILIIPFYNNIKYNINENEYKNNTNELIKGVKTKYIGDINSLEEEKIYTVKELIKEGYLTNKDKNPITGKKYSNNDKIKVINSNGTLIFKLINGKSLYEIISKKEKINQDYYLSENNYISFNENIYRILKINKNNIYIIKEIPETKISYYEVNNYLNSYKNDNIKSNYKDNIISIELPTIDLITSSYKNNKSYLYLNKNLWVVDKDNLKLYNFEDKEYINEEDGMINPVLIINGLTPVIKGNGAITNPYVLY